ncbi:GH92 family glycosyl hydrolase [Chitinophaga sancti]|uniref:Alpha-1,2-mannosidase, putative n=1 Tax=Chitinophaga sancti TaxID=1004 RepID=A0A1K1SI90_9BACT|nr:GH92 family glycosyl hydrolase [Chitinophaga sancti]WQD61780.1 GH92 family glycosyl hydrolase [Chitinophaga sancti]WQG92651.1 GH92 family glycosyl hydrolase [Chitinophaga sancti]SFW84030.1 alpha-1,2-mannosidase, putative [Chitinophaga sancti]
MILKIKSTQVRLMIVFLFCIQCKQLLAQKSSGGNYAEKVNTLIGSKGKGHGIQERYLEAGYTFPGAMYPFGMVQFTPTFFTEEKGFVVNQLSGAGCEHLGNFPMLPLPGALKTSPDSMLHLDPQYQVKSAVAGYYQVKVKAKIDCELTVTKRTGMARMRGLASEKKMTVVIGSGINSTTITDAQIKITGPGKCEGYANTGSFCGSPSTLKVYFVAAFDARPTASGTWKDKVIQASSTSATGENSGAYFTFDISSGKPVGYKFAISYVSLENARQNLAAENPGWSFDQVKQEATAAWNKYLGKIEVSGGKTDQVTQFYTHLYHSFGHPNVFNDVNGEYSGADHQVHKVEKGDYYTSFSNWDTYRTQGQLISMLAPKEMSDMVASQLAFAEQSGGGFARWIMGDTETGIMQGDPTAILVANAYAFGARDFDSKKALAIMRRGAEVPGTKSQNILTRPYLEQYLKKGYMHASMMLEYTSADFAIGRFALEAFNDSTLWRSYLKRAQAWKNLYNPSTGWLQSRNEDGSWKKYDEDWREASYKNYFWMVPYNLDGLVELSGGKAKAEQRLDEFFSKLNASYNQEWFAAGNEPDFQVPWVYNWVRAPYKTQETVWRILNEQYSNRDNGLPGNDDLGAMGAWYVFAGVGLYPMVPGVAGFSVNSPIFSSIHIHLGTGKTLVIRGGDAGKKYIKALKLNGVALDGTWIRWGDIRNGGALEFTLDGVADKNWGTKGVPPSYDND